MSEKAKKVLSVIANVILWSVIILAAFFAIVTLTTKDPNKVGNFLGYTPMSVKTDSMKPTFCAGDLIIVKKVDPNSLKVDDIITFHTIIEDQYSLNTHRIVKIEDANGTKIFTTKGDNNPIQDNDVVASGDVVGKYVMHIPFLGKVLDFLQSGVGFFICLLLPMLGFLVYQIYNLIQVAIKYKKAVALEQAEEVARVQAEAAAKVEAENKTKTDANDETARLKAELEEAKRKLAEAQAKKETDKDTAATDSAAEKEQKVTVEEKAVEEKAVEEKATEETIPESKITAETETNKAETNKTEEVKEEV